MGKAEFWLTNRWLKSKAPGLYVHQSTTPGDMIMVGNRCAFIAWDEVVEGDVRGGSSVYEQEGSAEA